MGDKDIRFGIIVPFYGVEKYIAKCLDSLVCQTYRNFVAILVDDESNDGSRAIAEEYQSKYPHLFMIVEEKNTGVGGARNFGFDNLPGDVEYFIFLDSDDYIDSRLLEKTNDVLKKERYDIVVYNFCEVDEDGHVFGTYNICDNKEGALSADEIRNHMKFTTIMQGRVYNKDFWKSTGARFPVGLWYEDTAIASFVFSKCKSLYQINETLSFYLQREGSIMNNSNLEKILDITKSLDYLKSLFMTDGSFGDYKNEIEASSAASVVVCFNRLNMFETGSKLQSRLADYLFKAFPDCAKSQYLGNDFRKKLELIRDKKFKKYYFKYSMIPKLKKDLKRVIPKELVKRYRNKKYC